MKMTDRERYRAFYGQHPDICIFSSPWWLDAVCGKDGWNVILVEKGGQIHASFPIFMKRFFLRGMRICLPPLTQKLGPYISYEQNLTSHTKRISYEHEIYEDIIRQLPEFDDLNLNFDQKYKNWLPFYWNGFRQQSRYSYRIHNIKDFEAVRKGYAKSKRYEIPKARRILALRYDLSPDAFYDYLAEVIKERGGKVSYTRGLFTSVYNAVYAHGAGRCLYCEDRDGNIHAVNLTVWDRTAAYYLVAMRKKEFNTSGGTEFLVDETIRYASQFVDTFDFEGSMMKGVEASYRNYGGEQEEYYNISKDNRLIVSLLKAAMHVLSNRRGQAKRKGLWKAPSGI